MLLISADLDELIGLSDTIRVLLRGRLVGDFDPQTVTPQELGSAMTGAGEVGSDPPQARRARPGGPAAVALVVAAIISSLVLLATGDDVAGFWDVLLSCPRAATSSTSSTPPRSSTSPVWLLPSGSG